MILRREVVVVCCCIVFPFRLIWRTVRRPEPAEPGALEAREDSRRAGAIKDAKTGAAPQQTGKSADQLWRKDDVRPAPASRLAVRVYSRLMSRRIAIVEDDPAIRANYTEALSRQGYSAAGYANREQAMAAFAMRLPDLAIIDIGLQHEVDGGFELCRALRAQSATLPIIFLTARDNDFDVVSGLRMGADDYLTKDVSLPHLLARIAALFRRADAAAAAPSADDIMERGALRLDVKRMTATWNGRPVELTLTEFWMVHALARHPGHVRNRDQLMREASMVVDDSTITSHIKRIRRKLLAVDAAFDHIETVYGMGYRWRE
jgi:two-component system, OmpR family, response regulator